VRAVDAFVEERDPRARGFAGADPAGTGRPADHPAVLLTLTIYGCLIRIRCSRQLEREARRRVELMWLTGRLAPDFKILADFRRANGDGIRAVRRRGSALATQAKSPAAARPLAGVADYCLRRRDAARPARPRLRRASVPGSGTVPADGTL
jgi:Transposase domain (DUF772)